MPENAASFNEICPIFRLLLNFKVVKLTYGPFKWEEVASLHQTKMCSDVF